VVATNADGTTVGDDMTFTTLAPGGTPKPGNSSNSVTLKAVPTTVIFGRGTTLSGKVTGPSNSGVKVTVEQNAYPFTGGFKTAGTAVTNAQGAYTLAVVPSLNSRYRVTAKTQPPVTSSEVLVNVRVKVSLKLSDSTPRRGQRVRFSGTVVPAHNGKVARIQRRTSTGGWRTIAKTSLIATTPVNGVARSKYTKRIRIFRNGTFRVRVSPADGDHVTGYSARRTARVH
jgi:hypothetical protein